MRSSRRYIWHLHLYISTSCYSFICAFRHYFFQLSDHAHVLNIWCLQSGKITAYTFGFVHTLLSYVCLIPSILNMSLIRDIRIFILVPELLGLVWYFLKMVFQNACFSPIHKYYILYYLNARTVSPKCCIYVHAFRVLQLSGCSRSWESIRFLAVICLSVQ